MVGLEAICFLIKIHGVAALNEGIWLSGVVGREMPWELYVQGFNCLELLLRQDILLDLRSLLDLSVKVYHCLSLKVFLNLRLHH